MGEARARFNQKLINIIFSRGSMGKLLHCLVRVTDALPTLWGVNHVQALLTKCG